MKSPQTEINERAIKIARARASLRVLTVAAGWALAMIAAFVLATSTFAAVTGLPAVLDRAAAERAL